MSWRGQPCARVINADYSPDLFGYRRPTWPNLLTQLGRLVKIFMLLPDGNISTAHLNVPYNELIRQHDSLLVLQLEITVRCLYPDDFVRHDNGAGNYAVHVLTTSHQTESASTNSRP